MVVHKEDKFPCPECGAMIRIIGAQCPECGLDATDLTMTGEINVSCVKCGELFSVFGSDECPKCGHLRRE